MILSDNYEKTKNILEKVGYFESITPLKFEKPPVELYRFYKSRAEDEMIIDILLARTDEVRRIITDSVEAESEEATVRIASRKDPIWRKKLRDSKQDRADIEKLEDEEIR
ncbi:MAG: hypothetical protein Kow0099_22550 [Candidatus Abyssubacteria bacterium]